MKRSFQTFICLSVLMSEAFSLNLWASEGHAQGGVPTSALMYAGINFLILMGLLTFFLRKPAKEFFASRAQLIKTNLTHAQQLRDGAEKKYQEYEQRLKNIESEGQELISNLKKDGEMERQMVVQLAEQQVTAMKSTTQKIMEQELIKTKEALKREAVELASELAEKLIQENMNNEDQQRLANEYLKKMEKLA